MASAAAGMYDRRV